VQPLLGGNREAARFGNRDEIAEVSQLHISCLTGMGSPAYKVFFKGTSAS
jgi:hypothetical protein